MGRAFGRIALGTWCLCAAGLSQPAVGEPWPAWRGPRGDSVSREQQVPLVWSERQNLAWKVALQGWGASTPIVWDDSLFLTSHFEDELFLVKLRTADGDVQWMRRLGAGQAARETPPGQERRQQRFHDLHNLASPSPVTDGEVVVAHFGNGLLAAVDFITGEVLWDRNLADDFGGYTIWWGHANSPVLYQDVVISACMQDSLTDLGEGPAPSYLVAHDLRTGQERWRTPRLTEATAEECDSYTTPVLWQKDDGADLVVMGANQLDAYDPATGEQRWRLPGLVGGRTITGPVVGLDTVFATRGMRGPLVAVPLDKSGELTASAIRWELEENTPDTCCPVLWRDLLFTISDAGIAQCVNAHTGHVQWKERLPGDYKASPVAAEGRIYFTNTDGLTTVVGASDRFEKLAANSLEGVCVASLAISGGRIYFRSREHLYAIGR